MKHFLSQFVPQWMKNYCYHLPLAVFAATWFRFPAQRTSSIVAGRSARKLKVIGVTGTNGKTTTTNLIGRILEESGKKIALSSTINYQMGDRRWVNASKYTTTSAWQVQKFLATALREGIEWVVLETSSHALHQFRVWGVPYHTAVITNVTREHLDYHKTDSEYRKAKKRLFKKAERAVVNLDMIKPEEYLEGDCLEKITYSTKNSAADVVASNINLDFKGAEFIALGRTFRTLLPGLFNVENVLAAIATGKLLGISVDTMAAALAKVEGIPGRMELIPNTRSLDIIIDYAVTPDALEKLYGAVLPLKIPGTKIIHVFGACGERDRGKRPLMGQIVSERADISILTNEDPYYEDPERILDEIEDGMVKKKINETFFRILDRRQAIKKALELAEEGDIVLVTGKGAEETMAIEAKRVPWNERRVIEEELKVL